MSYIVPDKLPKHCNKCPFGMCRYRFQSEVLKEKSDVDGKDNPLGTYGYTCNLNFRANGRYTKVIRAKKWEKH